MAKNPIKLIKALNEVINKNVIPDMITKKYGLDK